MDSSLFAGVLIGIIIVLVILLLRKGASSGSSAGTPTFTQAQPPAPVQKTGGKQAVAHATPPPAKTVTKHAASAPPPPPPAKTVTKHAAVPQPDKVQPAKYVQAHSSVSKEVGKHAVKHAPSGTSPTAPVPPDRLVDGDDEARAAKAPLK